MSGCGTSKSCRTGGCKDFSSKANHGTQTFRCVSCTKRFDEKEALCENWEDPSKSFICPHCEARLSRTPLGNSSTFELSTAIKAHWPKAILAILFGITVFLTPKLYGLWQGLLWGMYFAVVGLWWKNRRKACASPTYLIEEGTAFFESADRSFEKTVDAYQTSSTHNDVITPDVKQWQPSKH